MYVWDAFVKDACKRKAAETEEKCEKKTVIKWRKIQKKDSSKEYHQVKCKQASSHALKIHTHTHACTHVHKPLPW